MRSDNGPCYAPKEFQEFLECYSINHKTSNPMHPRNSGFVECLVDIATRLMEKAGKEGKPWNAGLLKFRMTLITLTIPSPLEVLMQRKPRTKLPQLPTNIGETAHNVHDALIRHQGNHIKVSYLEILGWR